MSNEIALQTAADTLRELQSQREPTQGRVRALLGDGVGNLIGPSGVPWLLARLGGDVSHLVQAYNGTPLIPSEGMSVTLLIRYTEGRVDHYEVERLSNDVPYVGYTPGSSGGVANHHLSHEYGQGGGEGGWDAVNVYERMFTSLRPNAQIPPALTIYVAPGYYYIDDTEYYFAGGNTGAFTPPGSGSEYHVVTLDASGVLAIEVGALTSPPPVFTVSSGVLPIAAVYLTAGQASITEGDIEDIRPFLSLSTPGSVISPATTVVSETTFGQASAVGVGVLYARNDHTHGTPAAPSGVQMAVFTFEGLLSTQTGALRIANELGTTKTLSKVYLTVNTAPVGASIIVDVNKNGTTVFTTQANRPVIVAAANAGFSTTIDVTSWAADDYLTVDIDQVGATPGANLVVHVVFS